MAKDLVPIVLLLGVGYWLIEKGGLEKLEQMMGSAGDNTGTTEGTPPADGEGGETPPEGGGEETPPEDGGEGGEEEEKKEKKGKKKKKKKSNYANAFFSNRYYHPGSMRTFRGRMSYG